LRLLFIDCGERVKKRSANRNTAASADQRKRRRARLNRIARGGKVAC
jgi:hypothetical protein